MIFVVRNVNVLKSFELHNFFVMSNLFAFDIFVPFNGNIF